MTVSIANRFSAIRGPRPLLRRPGPADRSATEKTLAGHWTSPRSAYLHSRAGPPHHEPDRHLWPWRTNLRPATFRTLIGLLACTGIRKCEALKLRDDDFDFAAGTLRVPATNGACRAPCRSIPLPFGPCAIISRFAIAASRAPAISSSGRLAAR